MTDIIKPLTPKFDGWIAHGNVSELMRSPYTVLLFDHLPNRLRVAR